VVKISLSNLPWEGNKTQLVRRPKGGEDEGLLQTFSTAPVAVVRKAYLPGSEPGFKRARLLGGLRADSPIYVRPVMADRTKLIAGGSEDVLPRFRPPPFSSKLFRNMLL
jgi:hypothetical protein